MVPDAQRHPVVLVVAGSDDLAADLRAILSPHVEVRDATEAPGEPPVVVIADLAQAERLDPSLRGVPLLVVIRRDSSTDGPRALEADAIDVLATPLEPVVVAARVALACRLVGAERRLEERNAELAAWAARAGHDLRQPLAVISGMAETLGAAWDRLEAADRARLLASIRNQSGRAMAMLDEALAAARGTVPAGPPAAVDQPADPH